MKKALIIKKNGSSIEVEYTEIESIMHLLEKAKMVTFGRKTIPVDTIEMIEWID